MAMEMNARFIRADIFWYEYKEESLRINWNNLSLALLELNC